ncbi:lipocalin-like domain-containing protein [Shewanella gaetbuli]
MSPLNRLSMILVLTTLLLVSGCNQAPEAPQSMGKIMGSSAEGYTEVVQGKKLTFPLDHQAHNDFKQEWWYLTANLTTESGEPLGIQWTQFRIALSAPKNTQEQTLLSPNQWQTNQLYTAHAALTSTHSHQIAQNWSRGHPQLAYTHTKPFTVALKNWQWRSKSNQMFPATLSVDTKDFAYQLTLISDTEFQLQGDQGYSIKSADNSVASYYYSQPFIKVTGSITRNGKQQNVQGDAWLDREWSSQFLTKSQQGWDWFSLRLNEQQTLMIFQLRGTAENPAFYSARLMNKDGRGRNINSRDNPNDISMTPITWTQTALGKHPTEWQINIEREQISLHTKALNPQSDMALSIAYWEGPIYFTGTHQGNGYMELTGYH